MQTAHLTRALFNVTDYGVAGDGQATDTAAIQSALDACGRAGGGTVYLPAGAYVSGSIFLRDRTSLYLEAGAILLGSQRAEDYPVVDSRWEGAERQTHASLISGEGLSDIAVAGRGVVDGRGALWWKLHRERRLAHPRPRLISFTRCRNVLIEGITATNSPSWTINPVLCEGVNVDKVTVLNPPDSPNTDGINPDSCRNVHIANCHVDVGDDCITIKSGKEGCQSLAPCENVTITNCTMVRGHGGVVIGSEMSGGVRNVVIANCVFTGTDRGIRLKSRRGRGGVIEDIRVSNIVMQDVLCPFTMNLYYAPGGAWGDKVVSDRRPRPVTSGTPRFRRIHMSQVTARGVRSAAGFLYGLAEMPLEDLTFSDIQISMAPDAGPGMPEMADGLVAMQRAGFFACNVRGLRLHHMDVEGQAGPAFTVEKASRVELSGCGTPTPAAGAPVIQMREVDGAFAHGCRAAEGTGVFLAASSCHELVMEGNDLHHARRPVEAVPEMASG